MQSKSRVSTFSTFLFLLILILLSGNVQRLLAQEGETRGVVGNDPAQEFEERNISSMEAENSDTDLVSIRESIRVSTNFDLYYWLDSLGLPAEGSKREKQRRLLNYYGIPLSALETTETREVQQSQYTIESEAGDAVQVERKNTVVETKASEIIIQNVEEANYFIFEEIDEGIFTLLGNVEIIVNERDKKKQYRIQTEKLIYNEDQRRGTAVGNVYFEEFEYTTTEPPESPTGEAKQAFTSELLSFDIDEFSSEVLIGNTTSKKEVKYGKDRDQNATLIFRIYSPHISTSKEDVTVVDRASFTTGNADPPIYRIALKKMWLLAPDEWAVNNAVVYLGNIPVMWIPFFFNPGDKFFFNPAIGLSSRNGAYINTTTYFIGARSSEKDEAPFLDIFDFASQKSDKKVFRGFHLREAEPGDTIYSYPSNWLLRLIADYYTGLGFYTDLKGEFSKLSFFDTLKFDLGLAVSRSVFKGNDTLIYYNYYYDEDNNFASNWDSGYFMHARIPFRYNFDFSTSFKFKSYVSSSLKIKHYSDSYILRDFSVRQFDFSWQQIFDPNFDEKSLNKRSSQISSFYWQSTTSFTIPLSKKFFGNYLKKFTISNVRFQLSWNRKTTESSAQPLAYTRGPGTIDEKVEGYYFYPSRIDMPTYKASMSGTLLEYKLSSSTKSNQVRETSGANNDATGESAGLKDLEPDSPYEYDENANKTPEESKNAQNEERLPYPKHEPRIPTVRKLDLSTMSGSLSYNISHSLQQQFYVDTRDKGQPEDYDFFGDSFIHYGLLTTDNTFQLKSSYNALASVLTLDNSFELSLKYKTLNTDKNLSDEDREKHRKTNDNYVTETLSTTNNVSLYYLKPFTYFQSSQIKYSASFKIAEHLFSTVEKRELIDLGDREWWNSHNALANLKFSYSFISQSFEVKQDIPPLDEIITLTYSFGTFFSDLSSSIAYIKREDGTYKTNPWNSSISLYYFDRNLSVTQTQKYMVEEGYWDSLSTNVKIWWFTTNFTMRYVENYTYDLAAAKFEGTDNKELRPEKLTFNFSYTLKDLWFWKERIRTNFDINLAYTHDFLKFINNKLTLTYKINFVIHEILTLNLSVGIKNQRVYSYFKTYTDQVGLDAPRSFFMDIADGLSFWDEEKRKNTAFELESINIGITQDFGAWVFNFAYNGKPKLKDSGTGKEYTWDSVFELSVSWKPMPEFSTYVYYRDEKWSLDEEVE